MSKDEQFDVKKFVARVAAKVPADSCGGVAELWEALFKKALITASQSLPPEHRQAAYCHAGIDPASLPALEQEYEEALKLIYGVDDLRDLVE